MFHEMLKPFRSDQRESTAGQRGAIGARGGACSTLSRPLKEARMLKIGRIALTLALALVILSCDFITGNTTSPIRQEKTTDASGVVTFQDPTTHEDMTVIVSEDGVPLPGADVAYIHGRARTYEAFLARDSRGLLAAKFLAHHSVVGFPVHYGTLESIDGDEAATAEDWLKDTGTVSKATYKETVPNAVIVARLEREMRTANILVMVMIAGSGIGAVPGLFIGVGAVVASEVDLDRLPKDPDRRWDIYEMRDGFWPFRRVIYVDSQAPSVRQSSVKVGDDDAVTVNIQAADPSFYPPYSPKELAGMEDATRGQGPTTDADLTYLLSCTDSIGNPCGLAQSKTTTARCRQDPCEPISIPLGVLPAGHYVVRYQVQDEVGNLSSPSELQFDAGGGGVLRGLIAFSSRDDSGTHIWVVNPEKPAELQQVTSGEFEDTLPFWSPTHRSIVFTRFDRSSNQMSLWIADLEAGGEQQLTASWNRGAGSLAVQSWINTTIYLVKDSGGSCQFLWTAPMSAQVPSAVERPVVGAENACEADVSGSRVVFRGYGQHVDILAGGLGADNSVSGLEVLVPAPAIEAQEYSLPRISPDGQSVVFSADGSLYLVDIAGKALSRLQGPPGFDPQWSSDGQWVLFSSNGDLMALRADGSGTIQQITSGPAVDSMPDQ